MIVAANWKMNPSLEGAGALAQALISRRFEAVQRYLFAPHPYLVPMSIRLQGSDVVLGGQDCHADTAGAHTGDVSAAMLRDCGAAIALVGHSERRADHGETSALVRAKAEQALAHDLAVMICVGETLAEREAGQAEQVVIDQLRASMPYDVSSGSVLIAYEPVWAIGTGKVASLEDIGAMHAAIAGELPTRQNGTGAPPIPVLYGGSVNAANAAAIFAVPHVAGGLVGGASLDAVAFDAICSAAAAAAVG
ncbi:MAG: triose-phosphate isomerase [Candidatus Puniceispirillum sp.]